MDSIPDILKDANVAPSSIMKYADNNYLRNMMTAAYYSEHKLNLPDGPAPYKKNDISSEVTKGAFWQICRKIDVFKRKDTKSLQRETQFIQALEGLSDVEANILNAVKDQNLPTLYPNLTFETLQSIGYFK